MLVNGLVNSLNLSGFIHIVGAYVHVIRMDIPYVCASFSSDSHHPRQLIKISAINSFRLSSAVRMFGVICQGRKKA